jgi:hypothetical protein
MFKLIKKILSYKRNNNFTISTNNSGLDDNYLFDFKNFSSDYNSNNTGTFITVGGNDGNVSPSINTISVNTKIKVKPKDVLHELETVPTPFTLTLIDEKISILKDKAKLITQVYAKREVVALLERMNNRKKYNKYKNYFDKFQNTTDEKIDNLLSKYDLVMKSSDIFITEFPDEAIITMKQYTEKFIKICGKKPVFYVIADEIKFKKAYEKRDPILLVQSPFGFYWQILGAWDEEMILLGEL